MHILPKTLLTQTTQLILNQNVEIHIQNNKKKNSLNFTFFLWSCCIFFVSSSKTSTKNPKKNKKIKQFPSTKIRNFLNQMILGNRLQILN